jgi:N6-L-threonylcarbamoyladenine synthase
MLVLGIETSCDETAAAIVRDGCEPLGESLSSQVNLHLKYGGVVPELASRGHVTFIDRVVNQALEKSKVSLSQLDAIAVTQGPGLIGALLVGVAFAKSVAYASHLPLVGVNHLEGHLYAICLEGHELQFPCVSLVVSGGHTHLFYLPQPGEYRLIGKTLDDAAGEALDKAAKVLGLGYPGGPILDRLGAGADPARIAFPRATLGPDSLDFSFSGLKTSMLRYTKSHPSSEVQAHLADIAASFQQAIVDVLVEKTMRAVRAFGVEAVVVGGGVASNTVLRKQMKDVTDRAGVGLLMPSPGYCTDNASMIAAAAYHHLVDGKTHGIELDARADLVLGG